MKINTISILLIILFLATFAFRLSITLDLPHFSSDEAYFHLRHIQHIAQHYSVLSYDPLSYGGRTVVYPPLYHHLMALLSLGNLTLLKILPELFASTLVFIAYALAKELTHDVRAAFASALLTNFIPFYLGETLNALSIFTLVIPLLYLILYTFIKLENKTHHFFFILLVIALALTHASAFLLITTFIVYFFLLAGGALHPSNLEREAVWYATLSIILIQYLIYRTVFATYGLDIIWQNTPVVILADQFRALDILEVIFAIGILPLILGAIALYAGITKEKKKSVTILSALMLATLTLLAFRFITIPTGLLILGTSLAILSALAFTTIFHYLEKTRIAHHAAFYYAAAITLIILIAVLPTITQFRTFRDLDPKTFFDMEWARTHLPENATILGTIDEGNRITALAQRKNVIDENFLLAPNPLERLNDVEDLYQIASTAKAKEKIKKYNITALYLSDTTQERYNVYEFRYIVNNACFKREGRFYLVTC